MFDCSLPCRVIVEPEPLSGAWNMAVDEALLDAAVDRGELTLRWYRWDQPTVSLGYFQSEAVAEVQPSLRGLPVVRRLSGGGALLHHHELTYCLTLPAAHPLAHQPRDLYTLVHARIVEVLAKFGVRANLRGEALVEKGREFLCFKRGDAFDVVMGADKVLGSAQRRRKGAVLQHGSLVLERSEFTPQFPGASDCAGTTLDAARLVERLAEGVGRLVSSELVRAELSPEDWSRAEGVLRLRKNSSPVP